MTILHDTFFDLPPAKQYWIAYSGGVDSETLLSLMAAEFPTLALRAIHIHHGLSPNADDWERHCRKRCAALNIPLIVKKIQIEKRAGESLEAKARAGRYQIFEEILEKDDVLVMAHHQDDQAETFLLQALRGAGIQGLSAMPRWNPPYYRPWLSVPRAAILDYAHEKNLDYVTDESNQDIRFDRNFLRRDIIPALESRWPSAQKTLSRSAALTAESMELLQEYLYRDLQDLMTERHTLKISPLLKKSRAEQRGLLRTWIQSINQPLPSEAILERLIDDLLHTREDAVPLVQWQETECRRFDDELYCLPQTPEPPEDWSESWDFQTPLELPAGCGRLHATWSQSNGIVMTTPVTVKFRQGGELVQRQGRAHHHTLKNCWQEWKVPPWERHKTPLICSAGTIAMVVDQEIMQGYSAQPGWVIQWDRERLKN